MLFRRVPNPRPHRARSQFGTSRRSGLPPAGFCVLFGSTHPFSASQLESLYESTSDYLKDYPKATDEDIKAGYILQADRAQVLAFAEQVQFRRLSHVGVASADLHVSQ